MNLSATGIAAAVTVSLWVIVMVVGGLAEIFQPADPEREKRQKKLDEEREYINTHIN